MDLGFMCLKAAFQLAWASVGSTSEQVSLGSFSFLKIQASSVLSSGSQHPASSPNQSCWKSNIVHSERVRLHCLTSALSSADVLRGTFPTSSDRWVEESSAYTAPMVVSNWATSLGWPSLKEKALHDCTVHICTTLWNICMTGDITLSSHRILMWKTWYMLHAFSVMISLTIGSISTADC